MKKLYLISTIDENYLPFTIEKAVEDKDLAIQEFLSVVKKFAKFLKYETDEDIINVDLLEDINDFEEALKTSDYIWKLPTKNGMNGEPTGLLYGIEDDNGNRIMLHEINY